MALPPQPTKCQSTIEAKIRSRILIPDAPHISCVGVLLALVSWWVWLAGNSHQEALDAARRNNDGRICEDCDVCLSVLIISQLKFPPFLVCVCSMRIRWLKTAVLYAVAILLGFLRSFSRASSLCHLIRYSERRFVHLPFLVGSPHVVVAVTVNRNELRRSRSGKTLSGPVKRILRAGPIFRDNHFKAKAVVVVGDACKRRDLTGGPDRCIAVGGTSSRSMRRDQGYARHNCYR